MIKQIITDIMKAEGWDKYTDHPADRGGPTKWGITLKAWQDYKGHVVRPIHIMDISEAQARTFYEKLYYYGPNYHRLPRQLAHLVMDCGVNHGTRRATKWLQKAVGVTADGVIGPKTLAAVGRFDWDATYLRIVAYRTKLFGRLVSSDTTLRRAREAGFNLQAEFAAGWNNRAMKFVLELADQLDNRRK